MYHQISNRYASISILKHLHVPTHSVHFISSSYHIVALFSASATHYFNGQDPQRTTTEQVLCGWWVILHTAVTLTWWWCVCVLGWCEWIRHSSAAGHLSITPGLRIVHQPKLSSQQRPVDGVLCAASCVQHPVTNDEGLEDDQHKLCGSR